MLAWKGPQTQFIWFASVAFTPLGIAGFYLSATWLLSRQDGG
jgi:hypothetical protein